MGTEHTGARKPPWHQFMEWYHRGLLERCVAYALFAFVFIAMLLIEVLVHIFPPERLLPVIAVCLLGLLFIMFRLLIDLADKDKKKPTIFANLAAAYPSIQESIREAQKLSGGGQPTRVDIITSTAASAIAHLKDNVGDLKNVQFRIAILSPDNSPARAVSETWPAEISSSTQWIKEQQKRKELSREQVTFEYRAYDFLPCLQGTLIDDRFLYLGHYHWKENPEPHAPRLEGAEYPYYYYDRNRLEDKSHVDLFKGWFRDYWEGFSQAKSLPAVAQVRRMWIIGHRGTRRDNVENTISTFREAVRLGANWVEMDVHTAADGLVVYHNDELGGHPVKEQKVEALRNFRYPNGEQIPTLKEAIDSIDRSIGLGIEIKDESSVRGLVDILRPLVPERRIVVSSFHEAALTQLKGLCPQLRIGILTESDVTNALQRMDAIGAEALFPRSDSVDENLVRLVQDAGLKLCPWDANDETEIRRLVALGVDGIITDYPERVVQVLQGK